MLNDVDTGAVPALHRDAAARAADAGGYLTQRVLYAAGDAGEGEGRHPAVGARGHKVLCASQVMRAVRKSRRRWGAVVTVPAVVRTRTSPVHCRALLAHAVSEGGLGGAAASAEGGVAAPEGGQEGRTRGEGSTKQLR